VYPELLPQQRKRGAAEHCPDLGIIAKRGNDGSLPIAVSDLRTTDPVNGVEVKVLDLQQRTMARKDQQGRYDHPLTTAHKPFHWWRQRKQRGYLKLTTAAR
jgi:hypothetical protein